MVFPVIPNSVVESTFDPANASYRCVLGRGEYWIREIPRAAILRIANVSGNQTAEALFFSAHDYSERYSAQDTMRQEKNIYLTSGARLISTRGQVLFTIVADTSGRHDALAGPCATESNMAHYAFNKRYIHTCRQNFLKALLDWGHGLTKRDIGSSLSVFRNVPVRSDGSLAFEERASEPGEYIELRAEIDVLAIISNCPNAGGAVHSENPANIEILIWDGKDSSVPNGA